MYVYMVSDTDKQMFSFQVYVCVYDRYFAFLEKCTDAKACTVLLRG